MITYIDEDNQELREALHPVEDEDHERSRMLSRFDQFFEANSVPKYELDITDIPLLDDAIALVLKEFFTVGYDAPYFIVWDHWPHCFVIQMADFVRYFEDIYFPGGDDVFLAAVDGSYFIHLSHEELIHIYDRAQTREGANLIEDGP